MGKRVIEPGDIVSGILFLRELPLYKGHRRGIFECPFCKKEIESSLRNIVCKNTKSCGCQQYVNRPKIHGQSGGVKPELRTTEYRIWAKMKQRCLNENNSSFHNYGGRGITICDRWRQSFENFYADMGKRPSLNHSLDRIDNNGNYDPANCRWATTKEQTRNTRLTLKVWYRGEFLPVKTICETYDLKYKMIDYYKSKYGLSTQEAFDRVAKVNRSTNLIPHSFGHINA